MEHHEEVLITAKPPLVIPKAAPVSAEVAELQCSGSGAIRVALALTLSPHLFTSVIGQAVLPLTLARALRFARLVLDPAETGLGLDSHYMFTG